MKTAQNIQEMWVEALPYIKEIEDKIVLIKFGGNAMVNDDSLISVLKDISLLKNLGVKPVLVHGGGPFISEQLDYLNMESEFHKGLRKTPKNVMEVVKKVLVGQINSKIVDYANTRANCRAVGLYGGDNQLITAEKYRAEDGTDLGFVGEVANINAEIVTSLLSSGYFPIIAPVGVDKDGDNYNINSDIAACEIAAALEAEEFIVMSDVDGVREDPKDASSVLNTLTPDEAETMIAKGQIDEGMIPKIKASIWAHKSAVNTACIINGTKKHILLQKFLTAVNTGTFIKT